MIDNIIKANTHGGTECTTAPVYQYNHGTKLQILEADLPELYRVDFSNNKYGTSKSVFCNGNILSVPYEYFIPGASIHCWVVDFDENNSVTRLHIIIPVNRRARPTEDDLEPEELSMFGQTMFLLNDGIRRVEEAETNIRQTIETELEAAKDTFQERITSLNDTLLSCGQTVETVGVPIYVSDITQYSNYGITDTGWYVFARIMAPDGAVTSETTVTGAAGSIISLGEDHVDVAVRFDVAAESRTVYIHWADNIYDTYIFKATDLAVRNLDYRTTFYIYNIEDYATWIYVLTTDTTFAANKHYYTKDGDSYTMAEVTVGAEVPADMYYNHSKLMFVGMVPNVTYKLDDIVDCPIEIVLPEVADDGHGAWFEIQMRYSGSYSCTLVPPEGVKIGTAQTQAQSAGINTIDLQYTVAGAVKMWTLLNTHSNIPA